MSELGTVLYIGGFELPDKNAAAQRVIGIAKGLRTVGYNVRFVNALRGYTQEAHETEYFGFKTFEYKREKNTDYLFRAPKAISIIKKECPVAVIAYNYPAVALNRIRKYCQANGIKCIADVTEWAEPVKGNIIYRIIKKLDTTYRMKYVHKHVDYVIAISRFLFNYYKDTVPTVLIPPVVDIQDEKWNVAVNKPSEITSFVYAGSPSETKERLDVIVKTIIECSKKDRIILNVVGISRSQFIKMYSWKDELPMNIVFHGRISHVEAIRVVKASTWSIIIRENNIVVKAGFPTKVAESISCGTPVITNDFSNVFDYIDNQNGMPIRCLDEIGYAIQNACKRRIIVNELCFDYHNYLNEISKLLEW